MFWTMFTEYCTAFHDFLFLLMLFLMPKISFLFFTAWQNYTYPSRASSNVIASKSLCLWPLDSQCVFCYSSTVTLSVWHKLKKQKENRTKDMKVMRHCEQLLYVSMLINVRISRMESKYQILKHTVKLQYLKHKGKKVLKGKYIKVFLNSIYTMPFIPILWRY